MMVRCPQLRPREHGHGRPWGPAGARLHLRPTMAVCPAPTKVEAASLAPPHLHTEGTMPEPHFIPGRDVGAEH